MELGEKINNIGGGGGGGGEDDFPLPGFRFHPTDQELVGLYLRRKVEKRSIKSELIKQVDIYKFDPWDLPKTSNVGDKEWYFFCKRGRKYRNSIRPNRVTDSGFWKATGIDKPIYSIGIGNGVPDNDGRKYNIIGLKKSLVYYRGSAGKGTKTDWTMHEFRLPPDHDHDKSTIHKRISQQEAVKQISQDEAEVWTLCRIFKRAVSYKKRIPDWREISIGNNPGDASSSYNHESGLISFQAYEVPHNEKKQLSDCHDNVSDEIVVGQLINLTSQAPTMAPNMNEFIEYGEWDELRSLMGLALDPSQSL